MWSHGGIRAYYRGLTLGLLGIIPYSAIDLGCFEGMKRAYKTARMKSRHCSYEDADPGISSIEFPDLGNFVVLCMGAISGSIGASIVFPINLLVYLPDTVAYYQRTRMQTQGTALLPYEYDGLSDVFRRTVNHEGVRGLFKGLT